MQSQSRDRFVSVLPPERLPPVLLVLGCVFVLTLVYAATASADDGYKQVRALGLAKPDGKGLLRVKLKDASTVLTHGLDPETRNSQGGALDFSGPERQPLCAADYFQHVLYGYPADGANRLAGVKASILAEIKRMDALLNEGALASGGLTAD